MNDPSRETYISLTPLGSIAVKLSATTSSWVLVAPRLIVTVPVGTWVSRVKGRISEGWPFTPFASTGVTAQ